MDLTWAEIRTLIKFCELTMDESRKKSLLMNKGEPENQRHQIIQAFDLTSLKVNDMILIIDPLEVHSNSE